VTLPAARRHGLAARHVAPRRLWKRVLTAVAATLTVVLVAGSVSAFVAYRRLDGNITRVRVDNLLGDARPEKVAEPIEDREARNILVMGSDKRSGRHARNVEGQRSDTTILLHLSADRSNATLVSIPRDSVVDIPMCRREDGGTVPAQSDQMFNVSFAEGGPACTIKTVETLTRIRIDHYVVIDFNGFRDMVNALGGVKVCVPYDVQDPQSHLDLKAGTQTVRGQQALAYVRTRHGLGNGSDLSRIERQQAFLSSMISKVRSTGLLLRPDRLYNFLAAATNSVTTDPDLGSLKAMASLAQDVRDLGTKDVTFVTVPNEAYPEDPNRVQWKESADALWTALRFDRPLPGSVGDGAAASPTSDPLVTPPERIAVQVLNGSGVAGAADRVARGLAKAGFDVVDVADANHDDYVTTKVLHDPAYDESGRTLGAALPGSSVTEDISLGRTLVVVVGADEPTVEKVSVSGSTASPGADEPLATRSADQDICS
jgi:LCP family protein required for cell wall assembly